MKNYYPSPPSRLRLLTLPCSPSHSCSKKRSCHAIWGVILFWLLLCPYLAPVLYHIESQEDEVHFFSTADGARINLSRYRSHNSTGNRNPQICHPCAQHGDDDDVIFVPAHVSSRRQVSQFLLQVCLCSTRGTRSKTDRTHPYCVLLSFDAQLGTGSSPLPRPSYYATEPLPTGHPLLPIFPHGRRSCPITSHSR
jgi:hypothetical protein